MAGPIAERVDLLGHPAVAVGAGAAHRAALSAKPPDLAGGLAQHGDLDRRRRGRRDGAHRRPGRDERAAGRSCGSGSSWPTRTSASSPSAPGLRMDDWRKVLEIIRKQPGVVAAAPEVISQAGITAGQDYGEGVNLVGFDPDTGIALGDLAAAVDPEGRSLLPDDQAERGRRHPARRAAGQPALGLPRRRRHAGARHPGQDEPGPRRGGARDSGGSRSPACSTPACSSTTTSSSS